ncbi:MAG: aminoacyl-tRNA hydrolase [Deltaproteobacteria bacterium]|nr:aminoacyl-tRNA hydrolase [Deltaproteobacteria bacterium]
MKLIVGLGNPGREYANHRHNIGHWVVDGLAKENRWKWEEASKWALEAWGDLENENVWLAKPLSYMNVSGAPVKALLKLRQLTPEDLVVIHDDMDLALGKMRWSIDSSHGGHNGVRAIIDALGTKAFCRLRLGVGRPPLHSDPADWVLQAFIKDDLFAAEKMTVEAMKSVHDFLKHGLEWVQNKYH